MLGQQSDPRPVQITHFALKDPARVALDLRALDGARIAVRGPPSIRARRRRSSVSVTATHRAAAADSGPFVMPCAPRSADTAKGRLVDPLAGATCNRPTAAVLAARIFLTTFRIDDDPTHHTVGHPYFPPVDVAGVTEAPVWADGPVCSWRTAAGLRALDEGAAPPDHPWPRRGVRPGAGGHLSGPRSGRRGERHPDVC